MCCHVDGWWLYFNHSFMAVINMAETRRVLLILSLNFSALISVLMAGLSFTREVVTCKHPATARPSWNVSDNSMNACCACWGPHLVLVWVFDGFELLLRFLFGHLWRTWWHQNNEVLQYMWRFCRFQHAYSSDSFNKVLENSGIQSGRSQKLKKNSVQDSNKISFEFDRSLRDSVCSPCQVVQWRSSNDRHSVKENYYVLLTSSISVIQKSQKQRLGSHKHKHSRKTEHDVIRRFFSVH